MIRQNTTICPKYTIFPNKSIKASEKENKPNKYDAVRMSSSAIPMIVFVYSSLDVQLQATSKLAVSNLKYRLLGFFLWCTQKLLAELPVLHLNFDDRNWKEKIKIQDTTL